LANLILEALKARGLTIDKLSQLTGVSERSLSLILEDQYEKLPPAPYVRGYIVKIAEVLNLEPQKLWQEYLKNNSSIRRSGNEDTLPQNRFAIPKFNKKIAVSSAIIVLVAGYLIFRLPGLLGQPELSITNPGDNQAVVSDPNFTIRGIMNPSDELTVNGDAVYPGKDGNFEKNIILQSGFNNVTFQIKKLLGKTYTITRQIFYQSTSTANGKNQ